MPEVCAAEVLHKVGDEGDGGVDVSGLAEVVVAVHVAARDAEDENHALKTYLSKRSKASCTLESGSARLIRKWHGPWNIRPS